MRPKYQAAFEAFAIAMLYLVIRSLLHGGARWVWLVGAIVWLTIATYRMLH